MNDTANEKGELILTKISVGKIFGAALKQKRLELGEKRELMRVYGQATNFKTGSSTYGAWVKFIGNFKAVNLETGETYLSGAIFLPQTVSEMLFSVLKDGGNTEFAFDIGVIGTATLVGYEFTVKPLIKANLSNPLKMLEERLGLMPSTQRLECLAGEVVSGEPVKVEAVAEAEAEIDKPKKSKK